MEMQQLFKRLGGIKPATGTEFCPLQEVEILSIEEKLKCRLPEGYRTFLSKFGSSAFKGASPDNPYIIFRSLTPLPAHISEDGRGMFDAFYGKEIKEQDAYSLSIRIQFYLGRMPDSIIPIGDDGGAGQICMGIHGVHAGKIYYWDQQNEALDEEEYLEEYDHARPSEALFQNVYLVAESFENFLHQLELMGEAA